MSDALPRSLKCCSAGCADLLVLGASDSHSYSAVSAIPTFHCLSTALSSISPLYTVSFVVHAGIAFCTLHAGIACLVLQLHVEILCLGFLACY